MNVFKWILRVLMAPMALVIISVALIAFVFTRAIEELLWMCDQVLGGVYNSD